MSKSVKDYRELAEEQNRLLWHLKQVVDWHTGFDDMRARITFDCKTMASWLMWGGLAPRPLELRIAQYMAQMNPSIHTLPESIRGLASMPEGDEDTYLRGPKP